MKPSVFTKIINKEIPCHKVYEDDLVIAFMDINPFMPGHVLIVPKVQIDHFDQLAVKDYVALFSVVKKISPVLRDAFNAKRTVMLAFGYDVPHAHIHLVPSDNANDAYAALYRHTKSSTTTSPDHATLEALAQKLRNELTNE